MGITKGVREPVLVGPAVASVQQAIENSGHQLVKMNENAYRCRVCHKTKTKRQFNFWIRCTCQSEEEYALPLHLQQIRKLKKAPIQDIGGAFSLSQHRVLSWNEAVQYMFCGLQGKS